MVTPMSMFLLCNFRYGGGISKKLACHIEDHRVKVCIWIISME